MESSVRIQICRTPLTDLVFLMRSRYKSERRVNHLDIFDAAELYTKCRALNVNSRENFGTAALQRFSFRNFICLNYVMHPLRCSLISSISSSKYNRPLSARTWPVTALTMTLSTLNNIQLHSIWEERTRGCRSLDRCLEKSG